MLFVDSFVENVDLIFPNSFCRSSHLSIKTSCSSIFCILMTFVCLFAAKQKERSENSWKKSSKIRIRRQPDRQRVHESEGGEIRQVIVVDGVDNNSWCRKWKLKKTGWVRHESSVFDALLRIRSKGFESKTQTSDSIENVIRTIPKQPASPASWYVSHCSTQT